MDSLNILKKDSSESRAIQNYYDVQLEIRKKLEGVIERNWEEIKSARLLTKEYLQRITDYYNMLYEFNEKIKRGRMRPINDYIENTFALYLYAFLKANKIDFELIIDKKEKFQKTNYFPDILIKKESAPKIAIEIKNDLGHERTTWHTNLNKKYLKFKKSRVNLFVLIITSANWETKKSKKMTSSPP